MKCLWFSGSFLESSIDKTDVLYKPLQMLHSNIRLLVLYVLRLLSIRKSRGHVSAFIECNTHGTLISHISASICSLCIEDDMHGAVSKMNKGEADMDY